MFKEVTLEEADKLAEAGLLWFDCYPFAYRPNQFWPAVWPELLRLPSIECSNSTLPRKFYILLEE